MYKKEFFSSVMQDILMKDKEFSDDIWYSSYSAAHTLSNKYSTLSKNLEEYHWKTKRLFIPREKMISEISVLIKFIKKFPIKNRGRDVHYYGDCVSVSVVDQVESFLSSDLTIFLFERDWVHTTSDNHHRVYEWCMNKSIGHKKKLLRKRKLKLNIDDTLYIRDIFEFFIDRVDNLKKEQELWKNRRIWKSRKKELFIFEVSMNTTYFTSDWYSDNKDTFHIAVSHVNEVYAKHSLHNWYQSIIKDACPSSNHQINKHTIKSLPITKHNIDLVKTSKKRYHRWNSFGSWYRSDLVGCYLT